MPLPRLLPLRKACEMYIAIRTTLLILHPLYRGVNQSYQGGVSPR
jgi:hypothetical protein